MSGAVEGVALQQVTKTDQHAALDHAMFAIEQGGADVRQALMEALHDADQEHGLTYSLAFDTMRDFVWALVADKFASRTTPPARSYADGVEDAAKVALKHAGILDLAQGHEDAEGQADRWYDGGKHSGHVIAAAIRLLSQGGKA